MNIISSVNKLKYITALTLGLSAMSVHAGGITLGGTRVVYQTNSKLYDLSVRNSSSNSTYLVQSWIENSKGEKQSDFIVAPPLYVSAPGNENALRLIYAGKPPAQDRETLYYLNVKAIPSVNKEQKKVKICW